MCWDAHLSNGSESENYAGRLRLIEEPYCCREGLGGSKSRQQHFGTNGVQKYTRLRSSDIQINWCDKQGNQEMPLEHR